MAESQTPSPLFPIDENGIKLLFSVCIFRVCGGPTMPTEFGEIRRGLSRQKAKRRGRPWHT